MPFGWVGDGAIMMWPGMMLAAIVAGDRAGAYSGPGFAGVINKYRVMGDGAQVVIDIVP